MAHSMVLESLPTVERLSSRVIRVLGLNPGRYTLQGTNTYIVGTGERRVLIDTGEAGRQDYIELLKGTLMNVKACVSKILITHWHYDHTGGLDAVHQLFPDSIPVVYKLPRSPSETTTDTEFLVDGSVVHSEGVTLKVVATPGHTEDHMALVLEEENAVFTGDCVLGQGSAVFEDLHSYMQSLSKLQAIKPSTLYPGHGPVVRNGSEKLQQYIDHRREREEQVIQELKRSMKQVTSMELVKEIYKDVDQSLWKGAEGNLNHHLHKLHREGRVDILYIVKTVCSDGVTVAWSLTWSDSTT